MGDEFELVGYSENPDRGGSARDRLGRGEERASEEQPTRTDHWWVWDLEDVCDDDRELESLRALMWRFTVKELKEWLDAYGVSKASARGKKKAGLVDLVMDEVMPRCLEDYMAVALPYGSDFIGDLRDLVRSGGRRVFDKHDVLYGVSMPVRAFPTTMLFDLSYEFVERVPQEALDLMSPLTDEAWDEYARMADVCSDFERYLACSAEFAGIVSIRDVADEWADKRGIEIDHLMRRVIASADRWIHLVSMRTVDVESVSYAICHDLLDMRLMRSGPIDLQVIDLLIDAHERVDRRPMDERCLEGEDVCGFVIDSPEVAELLDVLDRYVPDTARSSSFSNTIVLNLLYELRYRTDGADTCVDGLLASYYGVRATGEVAARIHAAAERLDRIILKWQLNGWSMAELAGREGADLPAIETLEQEYDEPSGYVTVEVTDEHTDPWAFDVERDLWKPLSMNERSARLAVDLFEKDEVYEKHYEEDGSRDDGIWVECDEENEAYLDEFGKWLKDAGTSQKAIEEHKTTMYAFLYFFVAHRMELPMRFGAYLARSYLGSYYISNALESSPASMRRIAESMEMFYQCMLEAGHVQQEDYDFLVKDMDEHLDEWCSLCDLNNNPDWRYYVR